MWTLPFSSCLEDLSMCLSPKSRIKVDTGKVIFLLTRPAICSDYGSGPKTVVARAGPETSERLRSSEMSPANKPGPAVGLLSPSSNPSDAYKSLCCNRRSSEERRRRGPSLTGTMRQRGLTPTERCQLIWRDRSDIPPTPAARWTPAKSLVYCIIRRVLQSTIALLYLARLHLAPSAEHLLHWFL